MIVFQGSATAWTSAVHCWAPHIFIPSLTPLFGTATAQVLQRCSQWLQTTVCHSDTSSPELCIAAAHDCHTLSDAVTTVLLPSAVHMATTGAARCPCDTMTNETILAHTVVLPHQHTCVSVCACVRV